MGVILAVPVLVIAIALVRFVQDNFEYISDEVKLSRIAIRK